MLRPVVVIALCYIAGIALGQLWLTEPFLMLWLAGFLLLLALGLVFRKVISVFMAVLLTVVAAAGAAAFVFVSLPPAGVVLDYVDTPVYIEGTIVEEPLHHDDHNAYRLRVEVQGMNIHRDCHFAFMFFYRFVYSTAGEIITGDRGSSWRGRAFACNAAGPKAETLIPKIFLSASAVYIPDRR